MGCLFLICRWLFMPDLILRVILCPLYNALSHYRKVAKEEQVEALASIKTNCVDDWDIDLADQRRHGIRTG